MNPRVMFALMIGVVVGIAVYITEVVTPPTVALVQDVFYAIVAGGAVFLLALAVKL